MRVRVPPRALARPLWAGPFRARGGTLLLAQQLLLSSCTSRGEGEGSPSAAAQLSPLSSLRDSEAGRFGPECGVCRPKAVKNQPIRPEKHDLGPAARSGRCCGQREYRVCTWISLPLCKNDCGSNLQACGNRPGLFKSGICPAADNSVQPWGRHSQHRGHLSLGPMVFSKTSVQGYG